MYIRKSDASRIQLFVARDLALQGILQGLYMTAVLNIITWNKAYALFARDTFVRRKSYMLKG